MTIGFRSATVGGGNVTAITNLSWGATEDGDFALLRWTYISGRTTTPPTGFTEYVPGRITGSGTQERRIYTRNCDGSETGAIGGWLISGIANRQCATLVVRSGVDLTTPIDGIAIDTTHTAQQAHNCPPYTPTVADCCFVAGISERASSIDSAFSEADPTWVERADTGNAAFGSGGTICAEYDDGLAMAHPAGVEYTPPNISGNHATGTLNIITDTLALRPAIVAPPETGFHRLDSGVWVPMPAHALVGGVWT